MNRTDVAFEITKMVSHAITSNVWFAEDSGKSSYEVSARKQATLLTEIFNSVFDNLSHEKASE